MKNLFLLFICLFAVQQSFAQCPGCVVDVPAGLPEDTIYLGLIPTATVGVYYEEDLSFRMPKTTDPVNANDPDVPAGLTIDEVTINSLTNLPPGLAWEVNQETYYPDEETDGCIRFCGTPFEAGTYEVGVIIDAVVFGISQSASFTLIMIVEPAVSITEGFSMANNIGCGSVEVDFTNNIASNGNPGITYSWDFGNGTESSSESPGTIVYDQPGVYEVIYEAVIDTVGYVLTGITVTESDCDDFPTFPDFSSAPDMRITVFRPDGQILFSNDPIDNTFPPISANGNWLLEDGDYLLAVIDEDSGINGDDDLCGTVNFNKFTGSTIDLGDFAIELSIFHPVTTVNSVDTVIVYEIPEEPTVEGSANSICDGDSVTLTSSYASNNAWYLDEELIQGAIDPTLVASLPGMYTVSYTSPEGCIVFSEAFMLDMIPLPDLPAFINDNNLLTLFDIDGLPDQYALQWYQDGEIIEGENGLSYCITEFAAYSLEVVDLVTGCSNVFTQNVPFNANESCTTGLNGNFFGAMGIQLSPNPSSGYLTLTIDLESTTNAELNIISLDGKRTLYGQTTFTPGVNEYTLDLTDRASGIYFLEIKIDGKVHTEKILLY